MTANCRSDLAAQIKERLTMPEVARFYGFEPNRAGFLRCPFHAGDRTASLKVYPGGGGWHCFGCQKGGTVIDFVMELYGLPFRAACVRLNVDFGLGLTSDKPDRKAVQEARRKAEERKKHIEAEEAEEIALLEEHRYWWEIKREFAPRADGYLHPLYEQAVKILPYLEYRLDCCADRRWRKSVKS